MDNKNNTTQMRVIRLVRNGDKYDYLIKITLNQSTNNLESLNAQIKQHINKKYSLSGLRIFNYQGLDFSSSDLDSINLSHTNSIIFYAPRSKYNIIK